MDRSSTTMQRNIYETGQQAPVEVGEVIKANNQAKMHDKERLIVIRYWV